MVLTNLQNPQPERNSYGAIAYDIRYGENLNGFAQFFKNGGVWVASHYLMRRVGSNNDLLIPVAELVNIIPKTLAGLLLIMSEDLSIPTPYRIEIGAVGIKGGYLGLGNRGQVSRVIHESQIRTTRILDKIDDDSIAEVIEAFLDDLYDIAGEVR